MAKTLEHLDRAFAALFDEKTRFCACGRETVSEVRLPFYVRRCPLVTCPQRSESWDALALLLGRFKKRQAYHDAQARELRV